MLIIFSCAYLRSVSPIMKGLIKENTLTEKGKMYLVHVGTPVQPILIFSETTLLTGMAPSSTFALCALTLVLSQMIGPNSRETNSIAGLDRSEQSVGAGSFSYRC